jgi:predicted outer membrane repeat protein
VDAEGGPTAQHRGFWFHRGEGPASVLDGLTIRGGHAGDYPWPGYLGGGILCDHSSPTIRNCTITGNYGQRGGGIACRCGGPSISHCTIMGNTADPNGEFGGGIYCTGMSVGGGEPLIADCAILDNVGGNGGGIATDFRINPTIIRCVISGNHAGVNGGAIYSWEDDFRLVDCIVSANVAEESCGGVYAYESSHPTIVNCLFTGNRGDNYPGCGGALHAGWGGYMTVVNCTFSGNSAPRGNGLFCDGSGAAAALNCIFWGDSGPELTDTSNGNLLVGYSCVQGGWAGTGNISDDPLFVDPLGGNYRLRSGSPCINTGNNAVVPSWAATDLDGAPRISDGTVDMGAYEFIKPRDLWVDDDAPCDPGPGDPALSDPLEDGSPEHPFDAIQEAIDAARDGDTVIVLDGLYTGIGNRDIDFEGKAITVRSQNGPADCIVDCQGSPQALHRGFWFHSGEGRDSVVCGFTITNGFAQRGGGAIGCAGSSPTITRNIITRNKALPDSYGGGGIFCIDGSSPAITHNVITWNELGYDSCGGGGILCCDGGSPTITDNTISNNRVPNTGYGGGIWCAWVTAPVIVGNTVAENTGGTGAGISCDHAASALIALNTVRGNYGEGLGGGICCMGREPATISNNLIAGNTGWAGGGLAFSSNGPSLTVNNTIADNTAQLDGGGVLNTYQASASLVNCILWGNRAGEGGQIALWAPYEGEWTALSVSYCDVEGGQDEAHVEPGCTLTWGDGNIDRAPRFVDPDDGNYRLKPGSRCINAGSNEAVPPTLTADLEGKPRIQGCAVDMGAYESDHVHGDVNGDGCVNVADMLVVRNSMGISPAAEDVVGADINGDGLVNVADLLIVRNQMGQGPACQ